MTRTALSPTVRRAAVSTGVAAVLTALGLIWTARAIIARPVYVSEMGAEAEITSGTFNAALLLLALGAALTTVGGSHPRPGWRLLGSWEVRWTLLVAATLFAVASRVPCSTGCPIPGSADFAANDVVHLTAAIGGFGLACIAMLQAASAKHHPAMRAVSLVGCIAVTVIAGTGGLLALGQSNTALGALCEFIAMSIAVAWLVPYALLALRAERAERAARTEADAGSVSAIQPPAAPETGAPAGLD